METVQTFKHSCIDTGLQDRTLKFRLQGPSAHFITRTTFLESLDALGIYDIVGMWKGEDNLEYFVAFRTSDSVEHLKQVSVFNVYKEVKAVVTNPHECIQVVRFYWVPVYVSNECFIDYLETKDLKVVTNEILKDENGLPSGVCQFKVLGTKQAISKLPHLLDFSLYNFQSLVRVPGREPMCLRCRRLGHLRSQCPELEESRQRRGQQQRGRNGYRGWEKPTPPPAATTEKEVEVSDDSDSDEGKSVNENIENETSHEEVNVDETINEEEKDKENIQETNVEVEKSKIDGTGNQNVSDISDKDSGNTDENSEILMKDDDTIACTQNSSFNDKHSIRKHRSEVKDKKKKKK